MNFDFQSAWPILKWPLLACLVLPGLLVYYGLHVVRRGIIFVDLALAQVATLGVCLCLMLGHAAGELHTFWWSFGFTLIGALIFTMTRSQNHHRVPQEALIGVVYVVAAALGILLLSQSAEGNEELKKTLVGDVLTVTPGQILKTMGLYAGIGLVHWLCRKPFLTISFHPEEARAAGWSVRGWDFVFYALFGLAVTSFLALGGVLLVFSYLIVPAVCANMLTQRLGMMLAIGWVIAVLGTLGGGMASFTLDLPTGAAIVCMLGAILIVVGAIAWWRNGRAAAQSSS